jgi:hypothetical protein
MGRVSMTLGKYTVAAGFDDTLALGEQINKVIQEILKGKSCLNRSISPDGSASA